MRHFSKHKTMSHCARGTYENASRARLILDFGASSRKHVSRSAAARRSYRLPPTRKGPCELPPCGRDAAPSASAPKPVVSSPIKPRSCYALKLGSRDWEFRKMTHFERRKGCGMRHFPGFALSTPDRIPEPAPLPGVRSGGKRLLTET